jgi:hypothetical protein
MRLTVFTMPAALLLLLCIACHPMNRKEASADAPTAKAESQKTEDKEGVTADSTTLTADREDNQFESPQKKGPGKGNAPVPAPTQAPAANPDWDKKIVKTAGLNIEVKNFPSFTDRLHRAVRQSGGYIAQEQESQYNFTIENTVTIKVPVDRFDDLLAQLPSDSDRLVEKKIGSEDVTMQVIDTKSRLETKRAVRERYLELLKQARSMKDILAIQGEINDIQEEMDAASGRIAYLGHSAAFSTIELKFYQVLDARALEDPSPSFLHKIELSAGEGWRWFSALVLGLVSLWPLWIGIGLGGLGWRKWLSRSQRKPAAPGI